MQAKAQRKWWLIQTMNTDWRAYQSEDSISEQSTFNSGEEREWIPREEDGMIVDRRWRAPSV